MVSTPITAINNPPAAPTVVTKTGVTISCEKPAAVVTIPQATDYEDKWGPAVRKVKVVVATNMSLAFSTDEDFLQTDKTNIFKMATDCMKTKEKAAYESWLKGEYVVTAWDFSADPPAGVDVSITTPQKWTAKVEALERMFKDQAPITPAQAKAWVLGSKDEDIALWKAVLWVVQAERSACGTEIGKCPYSFIEGVACRKFLGRFGRHAHGFKKAFPNSPELGLYADVKGMVEARLKDLNGDEE